MPEILNIGIIGLGVMGQRMLSRMQGHARLRPVLVWDADPARLAACLQQHPELRAAYSAEALIASPGLHGLYIATPPAAHLHLSHLGFDAGLGVLCEKPLSVDFEATRACIARIQREKLRAAVNFSLASSAGLSALQLAFGAAAHMPLGALQEVQISLAFAAWPRPWQAQAGSWLAERAEGGFTREVLSHFIFALQRVLGPAQVLAAAAQYPADGLSAETGLRAELRAAGVPVRIAAQVGGSVADDNRMLWRASEAELELRDWFTNVTQTRHGELPQPALLQGAGPLAQLDQWAALLDGHSHALPSYAEALAVQETIERLLVPQQRLEKV